MKKNSFSEIALRTISLELEAVSALQQRINEDFSKACSLIQTLLRGAGAGA